RDATEKLHPFAWWQILPLLLARRLDEHDLWSERRVELVRSERAGMNRPGDKFPKRLKILARRLVWIVIMRGRIVHIGCEPHSIAHSSALDEGQNVCDFEFAAPRRAIVALGDRFNAPFAVDVIDHDQAERHIRGNDLPGRR